MNYLYPRKRLSMVYRDLAGGEKRELKARFRKLLEEYPHIPRWLPTAVIRRFAFLILVFIPVFYAYRSMVTVLSDRGISALEAVIIFDFTVLFGWLALNFWTSAFGFLSLLRGQDSLDPARALRSGELAISPAARTAVVVAVHNEDVDAVFAGVRSVYESIRGTGRGEHFDFFVLSDTSDPGLWVKEEIAWAAACDDLGAHGRIFYRHRKARVGRKSGNIADFCRRWGAHYGYMIVLDSDSIMDGDTMVKLMLIMEARPDIGILQTSPKGINSRNMLSRIQQFSSHVYGAIFAAGSHYWQLGDMSFWGHNAIVRLAPFVKYCALPKAGGGPPFGGSILSHDFVEAALMRRAGWSVWLAPGLEGSYEQLPAVLPEELRRDRRWCQGNIQHLRLMGMRGISFGHRLLFFNGNMFYFSSFFWLLLIILTGTQAVRAAMRYIEFFPAPRLLFPVWPVQYRELSLHLLSLTAFFLFSSKIFGYIIVSMKRKAVAGYGGPVALTASLLLETFFSVILAPIRMMSHSSFVLKSLLGRKAEWGAQRRNAAGITVAEAFRNHFFGTCFAAVCAGIVYRYNEAVFWWLSVVLFPLMVSIPLSLMISNARFGAFFYRIGVFLTPEETSPPDELKSYRAYLERCGEKSAASDGFALAVADPAANALHLSFLPKERRFKRSISEYRDALESTAARRGPSSLTSAQKKELLCDPLRLRRLHERVRSMEEGQRRAAWGV